MNLTQSHIIAVCCIALATTILGVTHTLDSEDIANILIACLGSLSGHAIGYSAAIKDIYRVPDNDDHRSR